MRWYQDGSIATDFSYVQQIGNNKKTNTGN